VAISASVASKKSATVGDEEEVAGADRVFIVAGVAEVVCEDDLLVGRVAERAVYITHASYPRTGVRERGTQDMIRHCTKVRLPELEEFPGGFSRVREKA
jgi:hypothetical protein